MPAGKNIVVGVTVTNSGTLGGEEVVQLYITHQGMNSKAPLIALKGFKRIFLEKGESKKMRFVLTPAELSVINEKGLSQQPKGRISISVGGGQPGVKNKTTSNVVSGVLLIR